MKDAQSEVQIVDTLKKLSGVMLVKIDFDQASGVITFDESKVKSKVIATAIQSLGYEVTADETAGSKGKWSIFRIVLGISALIALGILVFEMFPAIREFISQYVRSEENTRKGLELLQEATP